MNKLAYNGDSFRDTATQSAEIGKWYPRHMRLLGALGATGTLARVVAVVERDQDIAPFSFVRQATHEFIFPPQPVTLKEDLSRVVDSTPGYSIYKDHMVFEPADAAAIKGLIRVSYADADSRVVFSVEDVLEDSELPSEALAAIEAVQLTEVQPS